MQGQLLPPSGDPKPFRLETVIGSTPALDFATDPATSKPKNLPDATPLYGLMLDPEHFQPWTRPLPMQPEARWREG